MFPRLLHIALNPFFQAIVVACIVIIFLPLGLQKFSAEQTDMNTTFDKTQFVYADLDHDGISERIHTFYNLAGNVGITLKTGNALLGQWNFKGKFGLNNTRLMTGDYNGNGRDEIYLFTLVDDSIMLQAIEYSLKPVLFLHDRFIARLGKNLKDPDYDILPGALTDMNGDGSGDLVFGINAGFSRQPRNVFIYDLLNDSLQRSPESGAFITKLVLSDLDEDGFDEILVSNYTASNFNDDPFPFTDTSCWTMVLNHNLDFLFPPEEFPGSMGNLDMIPIITGKEENFILLKYNHASSNEMFGKIFLSDLQGNITREKTIEPENLSEIGLWTSSSSDSKTIIKGYLENSGFFEISESLDIRQVSNFEYSRWKPVVLDIDRDGHDEIIILAMDHHRHLVLRDDFTNPVEIGFPVQSTYPVFSVKLNGKEPPQLSIQGDQDWKLFNYGINPVYKYRFLIYLGIYLALLGFILIIRKLYSFQLKKKYETEKKIATLQLSGIKAQMEPHFIMNTINTIGSSIYRQKGDEAYRLLLNFSGMVRSLLISSDKLTRSLKEETEFVRNYLELEKSRFRELFSYSIKLSDDVNPESIIPKMIIQIHAENALKHGLLPKKTGGILEIDIRTEQEYLVIMITDNGIGRNAATKNISQSTGRGMKILSQLFETYNKYNRRHLRQEVIDLYDDEKNPAGTKVVVFIPLDFNEGID